MEILTGVLSFFIPVDSSGITGFRRNDVGHDKDLLKNGKWKAELQPLEQDSEEEEAESETEEEMDLRPKQKWPQTQTYLD